MCVSITLQLRVIIFPKSWLCHVNIVSITSQPVLDITNIVVIVVVVIVVAAGFWLKCFKSDGRNSRTYVRNCENMDSSNERESYKPFSGDMRAHVSAEDSST